MRLNVKVALSVLAIGLSACTDDPGQTIDPLAPAVNSSREEAVQLSSVSSEPVSVETDLLLFRARAYGTATRTAGGEAETTSDATAKVALSICKPMDQQVAIAGVSERPTLRTGTITTSVDTMMLDGNPAVRGRSFVSNLTLLRGLIRVQEMKTISTTRVGANGSFRTSAGGTRLENVVIGGTTVQVSENMRVDLPGVGYVILNERIQTVTPHTVSLIVRGLHVFITEANDFGVPVGTEMIVAEAESGLTGGAAAAVLSGGAFGSEVRGSTLTSGPTASASHGCRGSDGETVEANLATAELPGVFALQSVHSTARGDVGVNRAYSITTNDVGLANLLNGKVRAEGSHAQAEMNTDGSTVRLDASGSRFASLAIDGHPGVTAAVNANTRLTLDGLGHVFLKRTIINRRTIEVRMIEIVVTVENEYGLPVGTHIIVGRAMAGVR